MAHTKGLPIRVHEPYGSVLKTNELLFKMAWRKDTGRKREGERDKKIDLSRRYAFLASF